MIEFSDQLSQIIDI